eukprot:768079-Hanusia_phi.AAC.2
MGNEYYCDISAVHLRPLSDIVRLRIGYNMLVSCLWKGEKLDMIDDATLSLSVCYSSTTSRKGSTREFWMQLSGS